MSQTDVSPYGTWVSPISAEMVAQGGVRLSAPWIENGVLWWLEGRAAEAGRSVLVRLEPGASPVDVVPAGFNVRTSVHEYGGGAYCIHDGVAYVSGFDDQRLYRVDPGGEPVPITPDVPERRHRYADGRVTPDGSLWIGVRERHAASDSASDVVNELVAVPTDGASEPRVVAEGRDFYSNPRISPDGSRLCFLAWNLPWMPWDGCELHVADLAPDGAVTNSEHVAGVDGEESIWQPEWSPSGDLVFASDRSGWWNLERIRDGRRAPLHAVAAEFGYPAWVFGARSFAFLGDGRIVCGYENGGFTRFGVLEPESGELEQLDVGLDSWRSPYVCDRRDRRGDRGRIAVGSDADRPCRRRHRHGGDRADEHRVGAFDGVALRPGVDRVPDGGRAHRPRALLPAGEPGRRGDATESFRRSS